MAATKCALLPALVPTGAVASCTGRQESHRATQMLKRPAAMPLPAVLVKARTGRDRRRHFMDGRFQFSCHAQGGDKAGCCSGGGGGGGGESQNGSGKCGSHGNMTETDPELVGLGKEFENLVAKKTMEEFESQYETGQMEGSITRNVVDDVVNIFPESTNNTREEKFLDVEELLAEAKSLSSSDGFIFDSDFEESLV